MPCGFCWPLRRRALSLIGRPRLTRWGSCSGGGASIEAGSPNEPRSATWSEIAVLHGMPSPVYLAILHRGEHRDHAAEREIHVRDGGARSVQHGAAAKIDRFELRLQRRKVGRG
jgi:hypothetical protein